MTCFPLYGHHKPSCFCRELGNVRKGLARVKQHWGSHCYGLDCVPPPSKFIYGRPNTPQSDIKKYVLGGRGKLGLDEVTREDNP